MYIHYFYHSTFGVETDEKYLLFDFFSHPLITPRVREALEKATIKKKKVYLFCTHAHSDHYSADIFDILKPFDTVYIFSSEVTPHVPKDFRSKVHFLSTYQSTNIDDMYIKAFGSTDEGNSFYISLNDRFTLFYAGDLNNWHWDQEANEYYQNLYKTNYLKELQIIASELSQVDLCFYPTDLRLGPNYLLGLKQFLEKVEISYLAPMHWNGHPKDISDLYELSNNYNFVLLETHNGCNFFTI